MNARAHAIVCPENTPPWASDLEYAKGLPREVIGIQLVPGERLYKTSRINFDTVHTINHNLQVKPIGIVPKHSASYGRLLQRWLHTIENRKSLHKNSKGDELNTGLLGTWPGYEEGLLAKAAMNEETNEAARSPVAIQRASSGSRGGIFSSLPTVDQRSTVQFAPSGGKSPAMRKSLLTEHIPENSQSFSGSKLVNPRSISNIPAPLAVGTSHGLTEGTIEETSNTALLRIKGNSFGWTSIRKRPSLAKWIIQAELLKSLATAREDIGLGERPVPTSGTVNENVGLPSEHLLVPQLDGDTDKPATFDDASSISSSATFQSSTLIGSESELNLAREQFFFLLAGNDHIRSMCSIANDLQDLRADAFETRIRRLLRLMSTDLKREATSQTQKATGSLVSRHAESLAQQLRQTYFESHDQVLTLDTISQDLSLSKKQLLDEWIRKKTDSVEDYDQILSEGEEVSDLDDEAADSDLPSLKSVTNFVLSSTAFSRFCAELQRFIVNAMWESVGRQWKAETATRLPLGFRELEKDEIRMSSSEHLGFLDRVQLTLENYSGQVWDWWPLRHPRAMLKKGKVRIYWRCVSNVHRQARVSLKFE